MKSKALQLASKSRLKNDRELSKTEIAQFLDDFARVVTGDEGKRKLISLRVPENLLEQFKIKASRKGIAYQTKIVELMRLWLRER